MSVTLPWSRPVFGVEWTELTASHLAAAVAAGTRRPDLVWLGRSYADGERREPMEWLAGLLAGLANGNGGLVVIGVGSAVVDPGRPTALRSDPIVLDAANYHRVQRLCREAVVPQLHNVGIRQVPAGDRDERGYLLIAVEASPLAPHSCVRDGGGLWYPVVEPDGSSMRHLFESEVADRYRSRVALADHLLHRATQVWTDGRDWRAADPGEWLDLSLSPAHPARVDLDAVQAQRIRDFASSWTVPAGLAGLDPAEHTIARRRLRLSGDRCRVELYADGTGFASVRAGTAGRLELGTVVLLHLLAGHATATGVGGDAMVAAGIRGAAVSVRPALHTVPVPVSGPELVAAARRIAADVLGDAGLPEPRLLRGDGVLVASAVEPELRDAVVNWAENAF